MGNDGNLVMYSRGVMIWQTGTAQSSTSWITNNAKTWLGPPPVPYTAGAYYNGYRTDCSGYVSMAWALGFSASTMTLGSYSHQITKDQLQEGDILLYAGEHTLIFYAWYDSSKTKYWVSC